MEKQSSGVQLGMPQALGTLLGGPMPGLEPQCRVSRAWGQSAKTELAPVLLDASAAP